MLQTKHVEVLLNDANHAEREFLILYDANQACREGFAEWCRPRTRAFTTVPASISGPFGGDAVAALEV